MKPTQTLEHLPQIAARQLGGLQADARLLAAVRTRARGGTTPRRKARPQLVFACVAAALCLTVGLAALVSGGGAPLAIAPQPSEGILDTRAAGGLPNAFGAAGQNELSDGSIAISGGADVTLSSLFAREENGNFPLVMVDGKTYRLLTSPQSLDSSLVGNELGPVGEFTLEPALSGGQGVVSNTVTPGAMVCAVDGMQGALLCAELNGQTRVFQRVGFAGTATVGGETLRDTLAPAEQVVALELSGVGEITDAQTAQSLMRVLYQNASFSGKSANVGANQSLVLHLQNGLCLQLLVSEDALSGCGTWSCPEFFEAFELAVSQG